MKYDGRIFMVALDSSTKEVNMSEADAENTPAIIMAIPIIIRFNFIILKFR